MTLPLPRYVVRSVTGYEITPAAANGSAGKPPSGRPLDAPRGRTSKHRRELAESRAAEMNAAA